MSAQSTSSTVSLVDGAGWTFTDGAGWTFTDGAGWT